jgi:uncharacterized RDD family membrane protein YckC
MNCKNCNNNIDLKNKKCLACGAKFTDQEIFRYMHSYEKVLDSNPLDPILASKSKRLLNFLIDSIFIMLFTVFSLASNSIIFIFFMPIYYFVFEGYVGKTFGKYITGTTVVSKDGTSPKSKQIIIRTLSRLIPFEWISFLSIRKPIGWHDSISGTVVVDDNLF